MKKWFIFFIGAVIVLLGFAAVADTKKNKQEKVTEKITTATPTTTHIPSPTQSQTTVVTSPLAIETMRKKQYPGSDITIEQTLSSGSNYNRYVVSYLSDGLKIYGLLTVPQGQTPQGGWPVILVNHGYIPPTQ